MLLLPIAVSKGCRMKASISSLPIYCHSPVFNSISVMMKAERALWFSPVVRQWVSERRLCISHTVSLPNHLRQIQGEAEVKGVEGSLMCQGLTPSPPQNTATQCKQHKHVHLIQNNNFTMYSGVQHLLGSNSFYSFNTLGGPHFW